MKEEIPLIVLAPILMIVLGFSLIAIYDVEDRYQQEAIKHECAQYHPKTGEFMWREEK